MSDWQPIETAPKDGTKIDLLFPEPRGRTINCLWLQDRWTGPNGGWFWRSATWDDFGELLPEHEWNVNHYPHMQPTHWMPLPEPPAAPSPTGGTTEAEGDGG